MTRLLGYARVSSDAQAESGGGMAAQEAALRQGAAAGRYELVDIITDEAVSARTIDRPGLNLLLERLEAGEAEGMVAAKLDRIARSVIGFGKLLERFDKNGWTLVALDLGVDTSTAAGRLVANVMSAVSEWERMAISERTKAALKAKQAAGIRVGRPRELDPDLEQRIVAMSKDHKAWKIAEVLNESGTPAARGGRWWPSQIQAVLARNCEHPSPNGSGETTNP